MNVYLIKILLKIEAAEQIVSLIVIFQNGCYQPSPHEIDQRRASCLA